MGVRNCIEIGDNLQRIMKRLFANQDLIKLLYFTDKDPLAHNFDSNFFEQKGFENYEDFIQKEIYEKLVKIVPRVGPKETANSLIAIRVTRGRRNMENDQFEDISIAIETFVPLTQWFIKDENLRPFKIMGEIQKSLNDKRINGLGHMIGGDFDLNFLTEEISCYEQTFSLISYD